MIQIEKYQNKQSYECLNGCLIGYVCYEEYDLEACDIFFGGGGYHLRLNRDYGQFRSNMTAANHSFMEQNKIPYKKKKVSRFTNKIDFLKFCLENNERIAVRVEAARLTYCKALQQTEDAPHYINILNIDNEKGLVYIADADITTLKPSTYSGWVELSMVLAAWKEQRYEYHIFYFEDACLEIEDVKKTSREGALNFIAEYVQGGEDFDGRPFGQKAVRELFTLLSQLFSTNYSQFGNVARNLNYQLKTGGFIAGKYFLKQLITRDLPGNEVVGQYEEIINSWNVCCLLLVKLGMTPDEKLLLRLTNMATSVLERELNCLTRIDREIRNQWEEESI